MAATWTKNTGLRALGVLVLFAMASCGGGGGSSNNAPGGGGGPAPVDPPAPTTPVLTAAQNLPGVVMAINSLSGGTGPAGAFRVGDFITVNFDLELDNGTQLDVADLNTARMYVSGPTDNYQIVIGSKSDVRARATQNTDGSWTYTFADPIPAVYAAPLNDTTSFGAGDGEMTGQALLAGTYTVGFEGYKNYQVEKDTYRDAANATFDFLFGTATILEPREVVTMANCNQCHSELRAHGEFRRDVKLCVLCHTAGAEDKNVSTAANGTPGATIDFKVMIHKIHNASRLPSAQGVAVNNDGTLNYAATPTPYELVGFGNSVIDFSEVTFPIWPNLSSAMPRNFGYTSLTPTQKTQDDNIRKGAATCTKCHGDPDDAGPLPAPAQGHFAYDNPSRAACGSCHDDIDWSKPYQKNLLTMAPQADDTSCAACHSNTGIVADTQLAHIHPINDPTLNSGLEFAITAFGEAGANNGNGKVDPGEKFSVTFAATKADGSAFDLSGLSSLSIGLNGPTTNRNLIHFIGIPIAGLPAGTNTATVNIPEVVQLEPAGTATAAAGETFTTSRGAHWNVTGALTAVRVRTATGTTTTLQDAAPALRNYIDVVSNVGFVRDGYIVIDDGLGNEEYQRVQTVDADGHRLWFGAPTSTTSYQWGIKFAHALGASVSAITTVSKTVGTDFTVNAAAGSVTEVTEFGAGNRVLVTYTGDFIMPAVFPEAISGTPDMGEAEGKWAGLALPSGTYELALYGYQSIVVAAYGETQTYRATSEPAVVNFLMGSATTIETFPIIDSLENCNQCHDDVYFHGSGRRSVTSCFMCHGAAGFEDRPRYVAPTVPSQPLIGLDFREMLHKIHMGADLANDFFYYGSSSTAYPNNWTAHTYAPIHLPATGGAKNCRVCHGADSEAFKLPHNRDYPGSSTQAKVWKKVCSSCHNGTDSVAHIDANTSPTGQESCGVCHSAGGIASVETVHKVR